MYKIIKFLNKHGGGAVLVAVFFGFLVVLPTLTIVFNLGGGFKGIYPSFSSTDESYYQQKSKKYPKEMVWAISILKKTKISLI